MGGGRGFYCTCGLFSIKVLKQRRMHCKAFSSFKRLQQTVDFYHSNHAVSRLPFMLVTPFYAKGSMHCCGVVASALIFFFGFWVDFWQKKNQLPSSAAQNMLKDIGKLCLWKTYKKQKFVPIYSPCVNPNHIKMQRNFPLKVKEIRQRGGSLPSNRRSIYNGVVSLLFSAASSADRVVSGAYKCRTNTANTVQCDTSHQTCGMEKNCSCQTEHVF